MAHENSDKKEMAHAIMLVKMGPLRTPDMKLDKSFVNISLIFHLNTVRSTQSLKYFFATRENLIKQSNIVFSTNFRYSEFARRLSFIKKYLNSLF